MFNLASVDKNILVPNKLRNVNLSFFGGLLQILARGT